MGTSMFFSHFFQWEIVFVTSCLLPRTRKPFQNGSLSYKEKSAPKGVKFFLNELTPVEKGSKNIK